MTGRPIRPINAKGVLPTFGEGIHASNQVGAHQASARAAGPHGPKHGPGRGARGELQAGERLAISWVGTRQRPLAGRGRGVEETMNLVKWVAIVSIIGICVFWLISKDDIRRMRQMRQM